MTGAAAAPGEAAGLAGEEAGMTEEEIAHRLDQEHWTLTRAGDKWLITPAAKTYEVGSLREAEMFCWGINEGFLACAEPDPEP